MSWFTVSLDDKTVKMKVMDVAEGQNIEDYGCAGCRRSSAKMEPVGDWTQCGFEYDKVATVFYCKKCDNYFALRYLVFHDWTGFDEGYKLGQSDGF